MPKSDLGVLRSTGRAIRAETRRDAIRDDPGTFSDVSEVALEDGFADECTGGRAGTANAGDDMVGSEGVDVSPEVDGENIMSDGGRVELVELRLRRFAGGSSSMTGSMCTWREPSAAPGNRVEVMVSREDEGVPDV